MWCHEFGNDREVPVHIQGPEPQKIHDILLARRGPPPLGHLGGAHVVGGVDVAGAPAPGQLAHEVELAGDAAQLVVGVDAALERAAPRRRLLDRPVELADHRRRVGHGVAGSGLEVEDRPGGVPDVSEGLRRGCCGERGSGHLEEGHALPEGGRDWYPWRHCM